MDDLSMDDLSTREMDDFMSNQTTQLTRPDIRSLWNRPVFEGKMREGSAVGVSFGEKLGLLRFRESQIDSVKISQV